MKIAITGATGFIGRHLVVRHLQVGDEVRILSRKPDVVTQKGVLVYNGNLLDGIEQLIQFVDGVDILYHCAAEIKDESIMFQVNVTGTHNLIESAKGRVKHWVQLSSTGVYGPIFSGKINENQKVSPNNTYERSKVESDNLVINAARNDYFSFSILRPSNVFGVDMINQSLFQLISAVDKGIFFYIGKKGANANYIPVENVVHALVLAGKNGQGKIYNVSDSLPIENFIENIANFLRKPAPKRRIPLSLVSFLGLIGDFVPGSPLTTGRVKALTNKVEYESLCIEKELGYKPLISIEDGLEMMVKRYIQSKKVL